MELDDLKEIWQSHHHTLEHSETEIKKLLSHKTSGILSKINKSIWFEGLITLALFFVCVWLLIVDVQSELMLFSMVLIILLLLNYIVKYRVLNNIIAEEETLKKSLDRLIYILDTYLKSYQILGWITIVGVGISYAYNIYIEYLAYLENKKTLNEFLFISGFLISFYIVYNIAFYYFVKWYYDYFYGKYLQNLKDCYHELEEYQE